MQNDESIWQCVNHGFCSFKVKIKQPKQTFCKNEYNGTGLCNRVSCPLANSNYATVIEKEGICYLYVKTVERAHTPKLLWEKTKLSRVYSQALEQIDKELQHWPDHMINRCKQRLTKIRQMLLRMRRLSLQIRPKSVPIKKKTEAREATREKKAERAAKVDLAIEHQLLERLKQGTYGDIYNFPKRNFDKVLEDNKEEDEETNEGDVDEFIEDESDEESELDESEFEEEYESEDEEFEVAPAKRQRRIEIEYEEEREPALANLAF